MPIQSLSSAEIIKFHNSTNSTSSQEGSSLFGEDEFSFGDFLDIINPLQHIPVISTIYRKITGDIIAPSMQIAGDALFGGPIGAAISIAKEAIKSQFSQDSTEKNETAINPATIANNTSQQSLQIINASDYSPASRLSINPAINIVEQHSDNNLFRQHTGSIGEALYKDALRSSGIKGTEKYAEVISSTKSPENNIDIIIGSSVGAG
ncbi:MAG: hypothetical protein ACI85N_000070 [Gammaproteobacteria bacterium]